MGVSAAWIGSAVGGLFARQAKGARSSILVQGSNNCSAPAGYTPGFTTAYVMVFAPSGSKGWSQVGYYKPAGQATMEWSQTYAPDYNNGEPINTFGNHALAGYTHHYTTEIGTCNPRTYPACLENYIDGTLFSTTPWSPDREWGASSAWHVEYSEESYYFGSNIPGTPSNPAIFGQTARLNYLDSNLAWHDADCAFLGPPVNDDPNHWGQEPKSSNCDLQWAYTSNPY